MRHTCEWGREKLTQATWRRTERSESDIKKIN